MSRRPATLGELRAAGYRTRPVKDEIRENLLRRLTSREPIFPGIVGYEDTVLPALANAVLSRHDFILLGLRGQAKSRILRELGSLLDPGIPVLAGSEVNDDPFSPISREGRLLVEERGDDAPIDWIGPDRRYVEKLATPDVTVADLIGDLDPIRAARGGHLLSDELTIHFGLLPRANRGIFAINELPDLSAKVQVGLFNVLQEGDVQIKGFPVRLPLDVLLVFSANPEDYTARGKIITPLKDRIGSEIRTHYPATRHEAMAITAQEAWLDARGRQAGALPIDVPAFVREVVEEVAFQARQDSKIDKRSGVSQRLPISLIENVTSNAERRALLAGEPVVVPRITDVYAALPAITGKFELEYEGELRGADNVARDIIRAAVGAVFNGYFSRADLRQVTEWFDLGGTLQVDDTLPAAELLDRTAQVQGLRELTSHAGIGKKAPAPAMASAIDFILEGMYAEKKIARSDDMQYQAAEQPRRPERPLRDTMLDEELPRMGGNRKKYYN
jgi:magnesium chelatase subunit I